MDSKAPGKYTSSQVIAPPLNKHEESLGGGYFEWFQPYFKKKRAAALYETPMGGYLSVYILVFIPQ